MSQSGLRKTSPLGKVDHVQYVWVPRNATRYHIITTLRVDDGSLLESNVMAQTRTPITSAMTLEAFQSDISCSIIKKNLHQTLHGKMVFL